MFQINIYRLEQLASDMQRQIRQLNRAMSETEDVINGLRGLSGMEAVIRKLRSEISGMEEERRNLFDMMTVLQQVAEIYRRGERDLMDYAEGIVRRNKRALHWNDIQINSDAVAVLGRLIH